MEWPFLNLRRESFLSTVILPIILRKYSKKLIYTYHEYSGRGWKRLIRKIECMPSILLSNAIIVVDPYFENDISKFFKHKKIYFSQIHTNIPKSSADYNVISYIHKDILSKCNALSTDIVICHFGFISSNKKIENVIEALHILKTNNNLHCVYLICGELKSNVESLNDYQNKIMQLINNYGLTDRVISTGYLAPEDVGNYIKASDLGIALYSEGASVRHGSCLSMLQEGILVITTVPNDGYIFEFKNIDNEQIILCDNDPTHIANIIEKYQKKHPKFAINEDVFSPKNTAERHLEIYNEVINGK